METQQKQKVKEGALSADIVIYKVLTDYHARGRNLSGEELVTVIERVAVQKKVDTTRVEMSFYDNRPGVFIAESLIEMVKADKISFSGIGKLILTDQGYDELKDVTSKYAENPKYKKEFEKLSDVLKRFLDYEDLSRR